MVEVGMPADAPIATQQFPNPGTGAHAVAVTVARDETVQR